MSAKSIFIMAGVALVIAVGYDQYKQKTGK